MSVLKVQYYGVDSDEFTEPTIAYGDDAGYDLYSAETITIVPHTCEGINCKFSTAIPRGYFGKIYSRSSLVKDHLVTAEGGVMDSGYRGEWFVILFNHGKKCFNIKPGDKIAQVVFMKKEFVEFVRMKDYNKLEYLKEENSVLEVVVLKKEELNLLKVNLPLKVSLMNLMKIKF